MSKSKVFIETYGCAVNQSDSEIMVGVLSKDFLIVDSPEDSDINIINTCIVKTPTENRMKFRINELTKTGKPLIVAGCMSDTEKSVIEKISPEASIVGVNSIENIGFVVESVLNGERVVMVDGEGAKLDLPKVRKNSVIDIVQVSSGCLGNCSFCQTRFARGELRSYPMKSIIREIEVGLNEGCKEFWLTSQDMGCYGLDIGANLPKLLKMASEIEGKFFLRVGMMNPTHVMNFVDDLVETFKSDKIFKFLHIPVQSGSDRVLKLMKRAYSVDDFMGIVTKFREEFPLLVLSTDVIVGFPGETEKDFEMTMRLIEELKPDVVNISAFGSRPGTDAAEMKQIDRNTIKDRTRKMSRLVNRVMKDQSLKWKNWEGEILIDEIKDGINIGRNGSYKQFSADGELGEFVKIKNSS